MTVMEKTASSAKTDQKEIYLVVSQTGSIVSKMLKGVTKAQYNHISVAFREDLEAMYSFGRRLTYFPFWGGFVAESPNHGTMKRFLEARIVVIAVPVSDEVYKKVHNRIDSMFAERKKYGYNYIGLFLAGINVPRKTEYRYYCSEFVKELYTLYHIDGYDQLPTIAQPEDFLKLPGRRVYKGTLREYVKQKNKVLK